VVKIDAVSFFLFFYPYSLLYRLDRILFFFACVFKYGAVCLFYKMCVNAKLPQCCRQIEKNEYYKPFKKSETNPKSLFLQMGS